MSIYLLVLCVSAVIFKGFSAANCGANEQWTVCPSPCAVHCPNSEASLSEEALCSSRDCLSDACTCLFNHRRLENGTCVPTQQCPPINCTKPNEYYDLCPPVCPTDDCTSAPDGRCDQLPFINIVLPCTPRCRCVRGYWRKNGVCVPLEQC